MSSHDWRQAGPATARRGLWGTWSVSIDRPKLLARWIMDEHWLTQGLPRDYLAVRRAEVLLRLSTMFELLQARRWEEQTSTTW